MVATPGVAFFLTKYIQAIDINGNNRTVIVSYDSMSSLSVGSRLEGLDHNPTTTKTPPLPIKTLYSSTEKKL